MEGMTLRCPGSQKSQDLPVELFGLEVWWGCVLVSLGPSSWMVSGCAMCCGRKGRVIQLPFEELECEMVKISKE